MKNKEKAINTNDSGVLKCEACSRQVPGPQAQAGLKHHCGGVLRWISKPPPMVSPEAGRSHQRW